MTNRQFLLLTLIISLFVCAGIATGQDDVCPDSPPPQLVIGQQGQVTPGAANNVRAEPASSGELLGEIPGEGFFTVLSGPVCGDGMAWWEIDYDGLIGWTVEGQGDTYWVVSVAPTPTPPPTPTPVLLPITTEELHTLTGHENWVTTLAFSPDSARLASGSYDSTIRLWDVEDGELTMTISQSQYREATDITFSPDGALLAASPVYGGSRIFLWDMETGELAQEIIDAHLANEGGTLRRLPVRTLAFTPDGEMLATGSLDGRLRFWDLGNGTMVRVVNEIGEPDIPPMPEAGSEIVSVAFNTDGSMVVYGRGNGEIRLWDNVADAPLESPSLTGEVNNAQVAFGADNTLVYHFASASAGITVWDIESNSERANFPVRDYGLIFDTALSPDGTLLAYIHGRANTDSCFYLMDMATGVSSDDQDCGTHRNGPRSVAFSPDGELVAVGYFDGTVRIWRILY